MIQSLRQACILRRMHAGARNRFEHAHVPTLSTLRGIFPQSIACAHAHSHAHANPDAHSNAHVNTQVFFTYINIGRYAQAHPRSHPQKDRETHSHVDRATGPPPPTPNTTCHHGPVYLDACHNCSTHFNPDIGLRSQQSAMSTKQWHKRRSP